MGPLFPQEVRLDLPDADIRYWPHFLDSTEADAYFRILKQTVPWQQDNIRVFGKTYPQPRLTALYGSDRKTYSYANITMRPHTFTPTLLTLKERVETIAPVHFTTCLLNLYRNGKDSNGWHADDERELGKNPVIASISLGETRSFHLRHRNKKELRYKLNLGHGSLLLMQGTTQECWLHQVPKTRRPTGERINLTFRVIR